MKGARAIAVRAIPVVLAAAAVAWALSSYGAVYVAGESMAPTLRRGDLVVYRRPPVTAEVGDVAWVECPGWRTGVLHRVVEVLIDDRLVLRGDANPIPDLQPVEPRDVHGIVVATLPLGRVGETVASIVRMLQSLVTSRIPMR